MKDTTEVRTLAGWRKLRLLTLRALAAKAGVQIQTVHKTERGRNIPTARTVRAISGALGVEPAQVVEFRPVLGLVEEVRS